MHIIFVNLSRLSGVTVRRCRKAGLTKNCCLHFFSFTNSSESDFFYFTAVFFLSSPFECEHVSFPTQIHWNCEYLQTAHTEKKKIMLNTRMTCKECKDKLVHKQQSGEKKPHPKWNKKVLDKKVCAPVLIPIRWVEAKQDWMLIASRFPAIFTVRMQH